MEPNFTVDEIVESFKSIRPHIMRICNQFKKDKGEEAFNNGQTQCPICNLLFEASKIELHVDNCIDSRRSSGGTKTSRQPLPKPVFSLMKDAQMKKALLDYGLPTTGDRTVRNFRFVLN
jgi:hypothetical protein